MSRSLAAEIASFGLAPAAGLGPTPLSEPEWRRLASQITTERMEGLLVAAVAAGALAVSADQEADVREAGRARAQTDLRIEREALQVVSRLDEAGVTHRILKGPAWAHSLYPDPSWRGFGDVDLLVAPHDWYRAIEVLESAGGRRLLPEIRPGFDARFGKDATIASASGVEIDLHRALVVGAWGFWADPDGLIARPAATVVVGGVSCPVLDADAAFVHACLNAALTDDPPRLLALRDVAQMALTGPADPVAVAELADRWRARAVVTTALELAAARLRIDLWASPIAGPFRSGRSPRVWERALMATYRGAGRGYTSQLAGAVALPGVRLKAAYLAGLARPQPSYLQARGWSLRQYLVRSAQKVRPKR